VWDAMKFCNYKELSATDGHHNFEPYLTLRGHKSSIMTLAGRDTNPLISGNQEGIIISGSENGQIKAWSIPHASYFLDTFGPNKDQNFCIATWDSAHGS
jgi:WD40 repeat protein